MQNQPTDTSNTTVFLFGAIFSILANLDYASLTDYAVKAFIGGVIWLAFKITGDYFTAKLHLFQEQSKKKGGQQ
jgi:hypothetical protein